MINCKGISPSVTECYAEQERRFV